MIVIESFHSFRVSCFTEKHKYRLVTLPIGYNKGKSENLGKTIINLILAEAQQLSDSIGSEVIEDFNTSLYEQVLE